MKVALVHDWINGMRGGERCLDAFLALYPEADIFTLFHIPGRTNERIDARVKKVSWLNQLPFSGRFYRALLPFYPLAIRSFSFAGYDLVISLSHAAAKNVRVPESVPHVVYCFTPMRYIWDQARSYFGALTPLLWPLISWLRRWDVAGAKRPRAFVSISRFISARIRCFYGRSAAVIYPPVESSWITRCGENERGEAFLWAGALVPYKRPDLVIEAFNQLGEKLWVAGDGPELGRMRSLAKGNVEFLGRIPDQELAARYRRCRALIFPGLEDFGIIPVECMAAGRPVIALEKGGTADTVRGIRHWIHKEKIDQIAVESASGVFIRDSQRAPLAELLASIRFFISCESRFQSRVIAEHARTFSPGRFAREWNDLLGRIGLASLSSPHAPAGELFFQPERSEPAVNTGKR